MQNIVTLTRFEYGAITNRPTAKRVINIISSAVLSCEFSSMANGDIYESKPIFIKTAGSYSICLQCFSSNSSGIASVTIYDYETNTLIASLGDINFYNLSTETFISVLPSFTLFDPKSIKIRLSVTGKSGSSFGYKIAAGEISFYKEA